MDFVCFKKRQRMTDDLECYPGDEKGKFKSAFCN